MTMMPNGTLCDATTGAQDVYRRATFDVLAANFLRNLKQAAVASAMASDPRATMKTWDGLVRVLAADHSKALHLLSGRPADATGRAGDPDGVSEFQRVLSVLELPAAKGTVSSTVGISDDGSRMRVVGFAFLDWFPAHRTLCFRHLFFDGKDSPATPSSATPPSSSSHASTAVGDEVRRHPVALLLTAATRRALNSLVRAAGDPATAADHVCVRLESPGPAERRRLAVQLRKMGFVPVSDYRRWFGDPFWGSEEAGSAKAEEVVASGVEDVGTVFACRWADFWGNVAGKAPWKSE
ncbi:hypothetical protein HDU96_000204 [Phlyctochytrium bullatum]|nr:hypothetical protein HDU96_000204 [Phlyctochytrium bullatum]